MPSILVTAPAAEPVSLAEAKAHLRATHAEDDALIIALIISARRVAEARTGLLFISQEWMFHLDDWPGDGRIAIPLGPLRAVKEVGVYGVGDAKTLVDPSLYTVDAVSRPARLLVDVGALGRSPARALNGIGIKVEAGFGATPSAVPQPLCQAVLLLVAHWYGHRGDEDGGGMPVSLDALLKPFREVRL